jgi:ribosome maturation factor RimP
VRARASAYTRHRWDFQTHAARGPRLKVGFAAHLFFDHMQNDPLQSDIERRLATTEPEVELLACERVGAERLRLVIDRAGGVDLELCERVTHQLVDLLRDFGLEVSSPGPQRPLTKPDHFRRFVGRRARVRTREPRDGHRSFTGELVGATDDEVTIAVPEGVTPQCGVVTIPYSEINRSNLLEGEEG